MIQGVLVCRPYQLTIKPLLSAPIQWYVSTLSVRTAHGTHNYAGYWGLVVTVVQDNKRMRQCKWNLHQALKIYSQMAFS